MNYNFTCTIILVSEKPELLENDIKLLGWSFAMGNTPDVCYAYKEYTPLDHATMVREIESVAETLKRYGHKVVQSGFELRRNNVK